MTCSNCNSYWSKIYFHCEVNLASVVFTTPSGKWSVLLMLMWIFHKSLLPNDDFFQTCIQNIWFRNFSTMDFSAIGVILSCTYTAIFKTTKFYVFLMTKRILSRPENQATSIAKLTWPTFSIHLALPGATDYSAITNWPEDLCTKYFATYLTFEWLLPTAAAAAVAECQL